MSNHLTGDPMQYGDSLSLRSNQHADARRKRSTSIVAARLVVAALLAAALSACGGDSGSEPNARFQMAVTPGSASSTLGTTTSFQVALTSTGATGPVALSLTGAPAGWQATFSPSATPTLVAGSTTNVTVAVSVPSNATAAPSGQALSVRAALGSDVIARSVTLTVSNEYVLTIPAGTGSSGAHWSAAGGSVLLLRAGTTLTIRNADGTPHSVHTDDDIPGFQHQQGSMTLGQEFSNVLGVGEDVIYCHDHGTATGQLTIRVQ